MWDEYVWLVVVGAFVMFFMAWGIGANDVANAFATSVGSKTLTLWQATVLAAIFEFAGAIGLGRNVSTTIGKRLAEPDEFTAIPEVLMWAMFSALVAASVWLLVATMLELPVSTTHSIVGGVIGAALVARGGSAINWGDIDEEEIFPLTGVAAVVISWIFSPVCSGIIAAFFYLVVRFAILRSSNSFSRAWWALPVLVGLCFFINAFYICDKGGVAKEFEFETDKSAWIAAIVAAVATAISIPIMLLLRSKYLKDEEKALEMAKKLEQDPEKVIGSDKDDSSGDDSSVNSSFFKKLSHAVNNNPLSNAINKHDPHHATAEEKTAAIHANAEKFDDRTEGVFRYLQVLTSCADSFAHGANDVGNAVGPFAAIYAIYRQGLFSDDDIGLPEWILVIGGAGIVLGLATYGYHIIRAIGVKFVKVTPSRGFVIELGSALVVVTGSYLGLPLSTTHCQVGAELFVGLCDGHRGVSWPILIRTALGWVVTLIFAGLISALIMALGIFTPNLRATEALDTIKAQLNDTSTTIHDAVTAKCSPRQLGNSIDPVTAYAWGASETFQYPLRIANGIEYVGELAANNMEECSSDRIVPPAEAALFPTVQEQIDGDIEDYIEANEE